MKPLLAITMGDAAGIGPEIIAKALSLDEVYDVCRPFVIGDASAMEMGVEVAGLSLRINRVAIARGWALQEGRHRRSEPR